MKISHPVIKSKNSFDFPTDKKGRLFIFTKTKQAEEFLKNEMPSLLNEDDSIDNYYIDEELYIE